MPHRLANRLLVSLQVGFLLLEFGHVSPKNSRAVILKNTLDNAFGIISWFLLGYTLSGGSYGKGNRFFGTDWGTTVDQWHSVQEFPPVLDTDAPALSPRGVYHAESSAHPDVLWTFYFAFASSAATIVSGAIAERAQLRAHLTLAVFMCGYIYAVPSYWLWSAQGWLSGLSGTLGAAKCS